jgi:CHAD domain-containing protein
VAPVDPASVARLDAELAARHEEALQALDDALGSERYATLLDVLVEAAREPQFAKAARQPAGTALARLVARPWRQLATSGRGRVGAGDLDPVGRDEDWHTVRIRGKRARYAVEAVARLVGGAAAALADALTEVQDVLGEHQDATVAADTWLAIARSDVDDHPLAIAVGRLVERERAAARRARKRFPAAWAAASGPQHTEWLRS